MGFQEPVVGMYQNVDNSVADGEHVEFRVGHESPPFMKVEAVGAREVYWRVPPGQHMPAAAQKTVYRGKAQDDAALLRIMLQME